MPNANLRIPLCPAKVACDGNELRAGRTMCGLCQKALEKKARKPPPLRGANTAVAQYEKRGLPYKD